MSSTVIPTLRYQDAPAAIAFLVEAFGFEARLVVEAPDGSVDHAQLVHGAGMLMVGSHRDDAYGSQLGAADDAHRPTGGIYVIVDDVHAHAERARRVGATITMEPQTEDYGGSSYTCTDPEGHVWSFGDYDPWESPA